MAIFIFTVTMMGFALIGWFMGGLIAGILFPNDFPGNHKLCWLISGIISVTIMFLGIFLDNIL